MISFRRHKISLTWAFLLSVAVIGLGVHFSPRSGKVPGTVVAISQRDAAQVFGSTLAAINNRPQVPVPSADSSAPPTPVLPQLQAPIPVSVPHTTVVSTPVSTIPPAQTVPGPTGGTAVCAQTADDQNISTNWGGYVAATQKYTSVSGSWGATHPGPNGNTNAADATWIGIGGWGTKDLIQTGTTNAVKPDGTVTSLAFYELLPAAAVIIPNFIIHGGDTIRASINQTTAGNWAIQITDATTGSSFSKNVSYASSYATAEWIEEDPSCPNGNLVPFAHFSSVSFSGGSTTVNGQLQTIKSSLAQTITLVTSAGQTISEPSVLGSDGASFTMTQN